MSTTVPWPNPSEVFVHSRSETENPASILIAHHDTFVLIHSSGTWRLRVNFRLPRDQRRPQPQALMLASSGIRLAHTLRRMQAFVMDKLIMEGVRPGSIPGRAQFGSSFFHDHRLPRQPRDGSGGDFSLINHRRRKVWRGDFDVERPAGRGLFHEQKGHYGGIVENPTGPRTAWALRRSSCGCSSLRFVCIFGEVQRHGQTQWSQDKRFNNIRYSCMPCMTPSQHRGRPRTA